MTMKMFHKRDLCDGGTVCIVIAAAVTQIHRVINCESYTRLPAYIVHSCLKGNLWEDRVRDTCNLSVIPSPFHVESTIISIFKKLRKSSKNHTIPCVCWRLTLAQRVTL